MRLRVQVCVISTIVLTLSGVASAQTTTGAIPGARWTQRSPLPGVTR